METGHYVKWVGLTPIAFVTPKNRKSKLLKLRTYFDTIPLYENLINLCKTLSRNYQRFQQPGLCPRMSFFLRNKFQEAMRMHGKLLSLKIPVPVLC